MDPFELYVLVRYSDRTLFEFRIRNVDVNSGQFVRYSTDCLDDRPYYNRTNVHSLIIKFRGCYEAASERTNIPLSSARTWTPFHPPPPRNSVIQIPIVNLFGKIKIIR